LNGLAGGIAEVEADGKKLCMGTFRRRSGMASPHLPPCRRPDADGYVDGACHVVCPVHNLKFHLSNGRDTNGEGYKLKTYPVEVRPDGLFIGLMEGGLFKWF
jgi:NAD-dependent dihydropyrimidine dehydrogenase PreA subunit